jgi:2-isopropylmalate synthase
MQNRKPQKITIFDTTLRDGEQTPGFGMTAEDKVKMAVQLDKLGVDYIEAGFPVSSEAEFEMVQKIVAETARAKIAALARTPNFKNTDNPYADIDAAGESLNDAIKNNRARIHYFIGTSPEQLRFNLDMTSDEVENSAKKGAHKITEHFLKRGSDIVDIEFSCEDATRTDDKFLVRMYRAVANEIYKAIDEIAPKYDMDPSDIKPVITLNVPDTVGYADPAEYGRIFTMFRSRIPEIDQKNIILSAHCHNDLGMATANTLSAIRHGAGQAEVTVNGIGERAGNASLEEVVMNIKKRPEDYGYTNVDTTKIKPSSALLEEITGEKCQKNKAIVGDNAFAHGSGLHQRGMLGNSKVYQIISPSEVGIESHQLVITRSSGTAAMINKLQHHGVVLPKALHHLVFENIKTYIDKKRRTKGLGDEEFMDAAIANPEMTEKAEQFDGNKMRLISVDYHKEKGKNTAKVKIEINGEVKEHEIEGSGPIEAAGSALKNLTDRIFTLDDFSVRAEAKGVEAPAKVEVVLKNGNEEKRRGYGFSTDTVEATLKATINALNSFEYEPRIFSKDEIGI